MMSGGLTDYASSLTIIDVDKLLVNERPVDSRLYQIGIELARLVTDLLNELTSKEQAYLPEEPSPTSSPEVYVHVVVFPVDGFLHEWLLNRDVVHDDGVLIFSKHHITSARHDVSARFPFPTLWDDQLAPFDLVFGFMPRQGQTELRSDPLPKVSRYLRPTVARYFCSLGRGNTNVIEDR